MNGEKKRKFIIDRSKWRCGGETGENAKGFGSTRLLNGEGYMCCLGQIAKQLGYINADLIGLGEPYELHDDDEKNFEENILVNSDTCNTDLTSDAMSINDDADITIKERERQLKARFKEEGISLVFVGKSIKNSKEWTTDCAKL